MEVNVHAPYRLYGVNSGNISFKPSSTAASVSGPEDRSIRQRRNRIKRKDENGKAEEEEKWSIGRRIKYMIVRKKSRSMRR